MGGKCLVLARLGTGREALGPGLGLAGGPGWRPWPEAQARGPYFFFVHEIKHAFFFIFGGEGGSRPPSENKKSPAFFYFVGKKKYGPDQGLPASPWPGAKASRPGPGLVQVPPKMSVRAQIIKNGPNRVQNRPFGLKLGPEACQDRSGAFGMGLTHSKGPSPAKKVCPSPPRKGFLVSPRNHRWGSVW